MTKSNLKALNAYFSAKSLTYEWTKESTNIIILPTAQNLLRSQDVGNISEKALKQVNKSLRFELPLNSTVNKNTQSFFFL